MRRPMAAAALIAVLALGAGCSSDSNPSGTAASGPRGAATGGNSQQVCADARKVISDSSAAFSKQMGQIAVAAATGGGDTEKAAVAKLKQTITDWSNGLRTQAEKAENADLKQALSDMSAGFAEAAAKFKSFKDTEKATEYLDSPKIQAASRKLETVCG